MRLASDYYWRGKALEDYTKDELIDIVQQVYKLLRLKDRDLVHEFYVYLLENDRPLKRGQWSDSSPK